MYLHYQTLPESTASITIDSTLYFGGDVTSQETMELLGEL